MRASIYCRISKDRVGAGLGVKAQEQDCRDLADSIGATVTSVHTDNDVSAYSGKPRPGYQALLRDVRDGKVDAVVVWHTDRLHRSPVELEDYIGACEPRGVRTYTVKAGHLDLSTPAGQLVARNMGAVARYEIDHAIERMRRAKQRSADSGTWKGGRRPFGYESDGVTIREDEAALLRKAVDDVLAGVSVGAIARTWNASGSTTTTGRPWRPHDPRRVLLRPRNAGLMEHRGEVVGEAGWPALVEPEKWRAVVRILTDSSRRTHAGTSAVRWLGSGLYRCGVCGTTVRADRARGGISTYRCRVGSHVTRAQEPVDEFVTAVLVERLRRPDLADLLREPEEGPDVRALEARAIELVERKNQLASVFAQGGIDAVQLAQGSKVLNDQIEDVRERIAAAYSASALDGIGSAPDPGSAWLDAPIERQRLVLDSLLTVTLLPSGRGRPAGWKPGEPYFRPETVNITWKGVG